MQDRYAGDIGDFGKFGLLKHIENEGLSIGVNWYLTEPVTKKESKNKDGKHKIGKDSKSFSEYMQCDVKLFEKLENVCKGKRSVSSIEAQNPLKTKCYYAEKIDVENREEWHKNALKKLENCDVVFLDPDNGLEVDSAKSSKKKLSKYAMLKEIKSYLDRGQSVVFYNHRSRKQVDEYFVALYQKLKKITKIKPVSLSFHKGTIRDYIILANSNHSERLFRAKYEMLHSKWGYKKICQDDEYYCKLQLVKNGECGYFIEYEDGTLYKRKCELYQADFGEKLYKMWWVDTRQLGPRYFTFDKKEVFNLWPDYPYKLNKKQLEIFDNATGFYWHNKMSGRFKEINLE